MSKNTVSLLLSLCLLFFSNLAHSRIIWHWEDEFSQRQQTKLQEWIEGTVDAIENTVGPYPFNLHIYFHKIHYAGEPVPWANTERSYRQGVHFHVNPGYSLRAFRADWTAAHELSHLLIPYFGKNHSWFAEGFASYMQYQVMQRMGVLTNKQTQARYRRHIRKAKNRYNLNNVPFVSAATSLRARRDFPTMYWGGAIYFLQVDKKLASQDNSLIEVLSEYLACCRYKRYKFDELIDKFDQLSSSKIFSEQYLTMKKKPGFPDSSNLF